MANSAPSNLDISAPLSFRQRTKVGGVWHEPGEACHWQRLGLDPERVHMMANAGKIGPRDGVNRVLGLDKKRAKDAKVDGADPGK